MSEILLQLASVSFAYDANQPILNGADLTLRRGERLALLGPNGAGKSTLLHLLVGLHKPQSGRIIAFGKTRSSEKDFLEVRQRAGLLFQDSDDQLFCPTVAEDVAFGPLNLGKSQSEALRITHETLSALKLEHLEHRVTHKLSGGQKRLVALACVLAMQPDVLLLDEPTNALDEATRQHLLYILHHLPQSLILISHDQEVCAKLTQRRLALEAGCLIPA